MFGFGVWEIVVIVLVALLVLGPERLPKMAKQLAQGMREFRRAANELQHTLEEAASELERPAKDVRAALHTPPESIAQEAPEPPAGDDKGRS